jgi:hypothetical protein
LLNSAAQTASLQQIALTGAQALEYILRIAAEWLNLNPDEVKVTPNLEFADTKFVPRELVDTMTSRSMGAPISLQTIHENLVKQGFTQREYEEEMDLIAQEDAESALRAASKMRVMMDAGVMPAPLPGKGTGAPAPQNAPQPPANAPQQPGK